MGRADVYSRPDAPDPVQPVEVVLELGHRHLPDAVRLDGSGEVDASGGEARVHLLGARGPGPGRGDGGGVIKTQRPRRLRPRTSLAKEAALLTALAGPLAGRIRGCTATTAWTPTPGRSGSS